MGQGKLLFKLISFNLQEAKLPEAKELLEELQGLKLDDARAVNAFVKRVEQLGIPMGEAFIKIAISKRKIGEILQTYVQGSLPEGIELPEMIDIPGMSGKAIMKGEVIVRLFKQVMEGYEITGHNADKLQAILIDPSKEGNVLTYVSLEDGREFTKRLSALTGRKFRVQTEEEWLAAKDQLSGDNWTWTETPYDKSHFVLRHLVIVNRNRNVPESRYNFIAVRLVEEL